MAVRKKLKRSILKDVKPTKQIHTSINKSLAVSIGKVFYL